MSEEQKQEEQQAIPSVANTEARDPAEDIRNQVVITRDPTFKRFYCDNIQSISYFHGNVKFTLASVDPQEDNRPTTKRLVGELVMPLQDFLGAVHDEVIFLERLKESGLIRGDVSVEKTDVKPEDIEQPPNSHP